MPVAPFQTTCRPFHLENSDGTTFSIVRVHGDLDVAGSVELHSAMDAILQREYPARLIVDLKDTPHIDSTGVGTLLEASREAGQRHVRFVLCELTRGPSRMLERTRLNTMFEIYPTIEEALDAPEGSPPGGERYH